jgi:hypothetical protein
MLIHYTGALHMITALTLKTLTTFTAAALTRAIQDAGYTGDSFTGAEFLGMTNSGEFCYYVTYKAEEGTDSTKVFLTYDQALGTVSAEY